MLSRPITESHGRAARPRRVNPGAPEHCQEAAQQIAAWQNNGTDLPQVAALFFAEGDTTVADFNTITGSNFPYQMIDVNTFFDLIGSAPPRIYWIVDGQVKHYWDETLGEDFLTTFAP